jgi:capsule polysaccharide export protein KpsE/RkpR
MFIEQRLKAVKQNLDDALQNFSEFASKNATFDVPSQAKSMLDSEATLEGQLVAAESELEAYKQVYTDNNIRVRTVEARVNELRHQVENISGNKANLSGDQSPIAGDFPSIRKLPLVGVRWANLYRETKIQETVYEMLTQEYELAKIQEAKEIPTVNVLDPPTLPEKSSFPPRILVAVLGTLFSIMLAATLVIGSESWKESKSPEKQLATQIWAQLAENDSTPRALVHRFWSKVGGKNGSNGNKAA